MNDPATRLRQQGYRLTPQRLMVLEVLAKNAGHLTAEGIHEQVVARFPFVNLSTIYRTLEMLTAEEIVRQAHLGKESRVFELINDGDPHHHLVCRRCGRIEHIASAHRTRAEEQLLSNTGFQVEETHVTSFGRCHRCRSSGKKR